MSICRLQNLTQRQKDQQEALWELLYTESEYIRALYVIHDVSVHFMRLLAAAIAIDYGCGYWLRLLAAAIGCGHWLPLLAVAIGCRYWLPLLAAAIGCGYCLKYMVYNFPHPNPNQVF